MNCPNCHTPIQENQAFCPNCSAKLSRPGSQAQWGPLPKLDLPPPPLPERLRATAAQLQAAGAAAGAAPGMPAAVAVQTGVETPVCVQCQRPLVNLRAQFCRYCGAAVQLPLGIITYVGRSDPGAPASETPFPELQLEPAPVRQNEPAPAVEAPVPAGRLCQQCGRALSPTARFCARCGASTPRRCTQCGNTLSETARFCARCGTPADR